MYGQGINALGELVDLGIKVGAVEKSGSWFSMDGGHMGQGRDKAVQFLRENPDKADKLTAVIREKLMQTPDQQLPPPVEAPKVDLNIDISADDFDLPE